MDAVQLIDEQKDRLVCDIVTGDEPKIYCEDPKTKQQPNVWVYRDEPNPTKVAGERSTSKQTVTSFFNKIEHVATIALENCGTVNSDW
ncbi:hypothetical protein EVAR_14567_1 [Eumeta japonica]|uniref:Uncharacterized protein n=1 Tax=Eumeta variegata TaxID=151549 RepID=A0A4C1UUZ1_EUMVA|nr:hypothetical protein EVAR_14567_1 [Eumeta japonica]